GGATRVAGAGGRGMTGVDATGVAIGATGGLSGSAKLFGAVSPIASSAPISTYQRNNATAAARSSGRAAAGVSGTLMARIVAQPGALHPPGKSPVNWPRCRFRRDPL